MTSDEFIRDALNAHGIFLKKGVRNTIETIEGLRIIGEEYPVSYMEGTAIDLLVEAKSLKGKLIIPIECKRGYVANKKWVFFKDKEQLSKFVYFFKGVGLQVSNIDYLQNVPVCIEGVEINLEKEKAPYKAASFKAIQDAAYQICKGTAGFLIKELNERKKSGLDKVADFALFPIIVTNAPLYICRYNDKSLDILTGNNKGDLEIESVPWLILKYPFTPPQSLHQQHLNVTLETYSLPETRGSHSKEGILILNSSNIKEFFEEQKGIN